MKNLIIVLIALVTLSACNDNSVSPSNPDTLPQITTPDGKEYTSFYDGPDIRIYKAYISIYKATSIDTLFITRDLYIGIPESVFPIELWLWYDIDIIQDYTIKINNVWDMTKEGKIMNVSIYDPINHQEKMLYSKKIQGVGTYYHLSNDTLLFNNVIKFNGMNIN